ncbi:c-type cytochrome [Ramlibacter sp. Leaf400]|uniref:c-type cytochrome n=1 Tax=Ramlibacter sp. Leaf400 TaxID=1736365 RepID=UPI0006FD733E|nr:cytochrome C [Ramlibacter sp. Leaf400]
MPRLARPLAFTAALAVCGPLAAADAGLLARGEQAYGRCAACHAIEQNRTGPAHCGLFGRKAGTAPGFETYSAAMKKSGLVWTEATLARFLANPMATVPGTTMTYLGVPEAEEREALVAWLRQATRPGKACKPPR